MKQFETMSELELLRYARTAIRGFWAEEFEKLSLNPRNRPAKYFSDIYWNKYEELDAEIRRLERKVTQY